MKRFLIVLLSLHLATGGILFAELAKLPFLSQHFQDHRKQNPQIDFAQFLWMHYVVNKHKHSDGNKCHSQLPLCCMHFSTAETVCALPPMVALVIQMADPVCQKSNFPSYSFPLLEGKIFGIFQPPKTA